jgi:hypothetical protein
MASSRRGLSSMAVFAIVILALMVVSPAWTADKPNILFIMGDDIGWMQVGAYHEGIGLGETPNIDRIAHEGGTGVQIPLAWPTNAVGQVSIARRTSDAKKCTTEMAISRAGLSQFSVGYAV